MSQRHEETLSAGWHADRKTSQDGFLDLMGSSKGVKVQVHSSKRKDKKKQSLFSSKRASEYKVAFENDPEYNSEKGDSVMQMAVKPLNSLETQPSRFDSIEIPVKVGAAPKQQRFENYMPQLSSKASDYEIKDEEWSKAEEEEQAEVKSDRKEEVKEDDEDKGFEEHQELFQKIDQEDAVKKGFQDCIGYGSLRRVRSLPQIHSQQSFKDQLKEIEINQDLNNIQAFAPYRNKHLADHETEIELYINKAITRDRRHLGALIGAGVLGVVGFFVLSSLTVVGGIAGGVVAGVGIGRMAGKCVKRKLNLAKLDVGSVVQIRLSAMLRWARVNRKKLTIEKFSSILEKLIFEAKTCQQINTSKPKKVKAALKAVRKFLLNRRSQIALLYYTGNFQKELNDNTDSNVQKNFERFVYQVFYIIVPLIRILDLEKNNQHKDLEIYRRCVTLLDDQDLVQMLHKFIQKENLDIHQNTAEMTPFGGELAYQKSLSTVFSPVRVSKVDRTEEVEKIEIKKMLSVAMQEPAIITPVERRLNHQILEQASKLEEKRMTLRRRNSDPAQIVNIQEANEVRIKKKLQEMNQLRRFMWQKTPIINPNSIQIEIDPTRKYNPALRFITRFDAIEACKPLHGDIYDEPLPTDYDDDQEEQIVNKQAEKGKKQGQKGKKEVQKGENQEDEKGEDQQNLNSEQSQEQFKGPADRNPDIPESFYKLHKIANEEGDMWHKVLQDQIIVVYRKKIKNEKCVMVKSHSILRGIDLDVAVKAILDIDFRFSWDKLFDVLKSIENKDDERESVLYYKVVTPLGVSQRDFVQQRTLRKDFPTKGSVTLHFKSIEDDRFPPVKRVVRGQTRIAGYIFEKIEPGTPEYANYMHECVGEGSTLPCSRLTIVSQNDIKGLVPKWIVNKVASKAPRQWVKTFITACSKLSGRPVIDPPKSKKKK